MKGQDQSSQRGNGSERSGPRKLAEWITMGASALIVLSVAGYLVYATMQPSTPFVDPLVVVQSDQAQQRGGQWVVPVEITNSGPRTLRKLEAEVTWDAAGGVKEKRKIQVDYLGRNARHTSYIHVGGDPSQLNFQALPQTYQLE